MSFGISFALACWLHSNTAIKMTDHQLITMSIYGERFVEREWIFEVDGKEFGRYAEAEQYQHEKFCPMVEL